MIAITERRIQQIPNPRWFESDQLIQAQVEFLVRNSDTVVYPGDIFTADELPEIVRIGGNTQYAEYLKGLISVGCGD